MSAQIDVRLKCDHCDRTCVIQAPLTGKSILKLRVDLKSAGLRNWNVYVDHYGLRNYHVTCECPEHINR